MGYNPILLKYTTGFWLCLFLSAPPPVKADSFTQPTLEQLDSAANVLRVILDGGGGSLKLKAHNCVISPEEATSMIQLVKEKIDRSTSRFNSGRVKAGQKAPISKKILKKIAASCQQSCHCGLYSSWLEPYYSKHKDFEKINQKAQALSAQDAIRCAKTSVKWFCSSSLLKQLRQDLKRYY